MASFVSTRQSRSESKSAARIRRSSILVALLAIYRNGVSRLRPENAHLHIVDPPNYALQRLRLLLTSYGAHSQRFGAQRAQSSHRRVSRDRRSRHLLLAHFILQSERRCQFFFSLCIIVERLRLPFVVARGSLVSFWPRALTTITRKLAAALV